MIALGELTPKLVCEPRDHPGKSDGQSDESWFAASAELEAQEVKRGGWFSEGLSRR
jgi:hypothetical protein